VYACITLQVRPTRQSLTSLEFRVAQGLVLRLGRHRYVLTQHGYPASTA